MFSDLHLAKSLPVLPRSVPFGVRQLCYAARCLPRGYGRTLPRIASLARSLHKLTVTLEDVGLFAIDLRESVCAALFARGCYTHQLPEDRVLDRLLSSGMTVFDIGANIGYYTKFMSRRVGPTGTVIAVEPMPRALSLLRENASANVTVLPFAIGASPGRAAVQEMRELDVSFVQFGAEAGRGVQVVTIDSLSQTYGRPDLIKIDVEGAELAAFDGAVATFGSTDPPIILFEYVADNTKEFGSYGLADLLKRITASHEVFRIVAPGALVPDHNVGGATNDYLAIPRRRTAAVFPRMEHVA